MGLPCTTLDMLMGRQEIMWKKFSITRRPLPSDSGSKKVEALRA